MSIPNYSYEEIRECLQGCPEGLTVPGIISTLGYIPPSWEVANHRNKILKRLRRMLKANEVVHEVHPDNVVIWRWVQ